MELTIELLREAGARLPAKIGQTIGIVGGIVIGQAAVQAGLDEKYFDHCRGILGDSIVCHSELCHERFDSAYSLRIDFISRCLGDARADYRSRFDRNPSVRADQLERLVSNTVSTDAMVRLEGTFIRGPFRTLKESRSETMSQEDPQHKMNKQRR